MVGRAAVNANSKDADNERSALPEGNKLRVTRRVVNPLTLGMRELCAMDLEEIEELPIICGSGTPKGRISGCKGVLLENVIRMAEVIKEEDNDTKKMFIVASAKDGFKVVFSWQEIFNTAVGGGALILIEKEGKALDIEKDQLELISTEDYFTGARYVKGLERIEIVLAR